MTDIQIDIMCSEILSYASTHNGRPVIQRLAVSTTRGQVIQDAEVSIELDSLGTAMAEPWVRELKQIGPVATVWDSIAIRLDANALYSFTDQRPATLIVRVRQGDQEIAAKRIDIKILAANAWVCAAPFDDYALMLAAFVMPNHPSLRPVLDDASRRLAAMGLDSGLSGYQGDAAHVTGIVAAIYESVRALGLTYVNPPASWDMHSNPDIWGQRVRSPGEVLGERAGTCLDTAVLMASLLENVGLKPILVVVPGHALVAYWRADREDLAFPAPVWPIASGMNFIDEGNIGTFETTTLCGREQSTPFEGAVAEGRRRIVDFGALDDRGAALSFFVDVASARVRNRVLPIPARIVHDDGTIEIVEYKPQDFAINLLQQALKVENGGTRSGLRAGAAPPRVERWKNSLLDLSLRNPLIKQRTTTSVSLAVPRGTLGTIEDLLQSGHELQLLPSILTNVEDGRPVELNARGGLDNQFNTQLESLLTTERAVSTNVAAEVFVLRLRRIASLAKSLIQDTGNNNLFLAMGSLVWRPEGKSEEVRSPLILVPVSIKAYNRSSSFRLTIDETSAVTPNYSLAEKLLQDANFKLPKLTEPDLDDAGVDINRLLAYVREEITKAKLQGFRVDETCTLGFFDFSTYRLWRDLSDNWSTFVRAPLVNHLVHTPQLAFIDTAPQDDHAEELDDLAAMLPIATDGSQVTAVSKAMAGQTFVLQGPPGTGKSQTITNLLARALHSGKRVLFIAEKAPALNVVKDRLEAVGLGPFILNLHDKGLRPAAVRQQLSAVMDAAVAPDREGLGAAQSDLNRSLPALQRYPERVHSLGKFNESAFSARNKLLAQSKIAELPIPSAFLTSADLGIKAEISRVLREVADVGANAGTSLDNPWSLATMAAVDLTAEASARLTTALQVMSDETTWLRGSVGASEFLAGIESIQEISYLAGLAHANAPSLSTIDAAALPTAVGARAELAESISRLDNAAYPTKVAARTLFAPTAELQTGVTAARDSFVIGRKKKLESECRRVEGHLADGSTVTTEELETTIELIASVQREIHALIAHAQSVAGFIVPEGWNPLDPAQRPAALLQLQWIDYWVSFLGDAGTPPRTRVRHLIGSADQAMIASLAKLGTAAMEFDSLVRPSASSLSLWKGEGTIGQAWAKSIDGWQRDATERGLTRLRRWTVLFELLSPLRHAGLVEAERRILSGATVYRDADAAFERGFLEAVFRRQLDDENLDTFDGASHDVTVASFARAGASIRSAIPSVLGADLIAARGFDGGVTIGAVGELKRELNRSRGGKPIRRLIKEHWTVISRLTPCVLASPDSVVRFIDADLEPFDLVVFDEASQIRVPHAIGALGRARAAVIVGDSKQMPPTSIAEASLATDDDESETDEAIVLDEESILSESVQARVPDVMLAWHYRSEDESLIAFSNQQYYDGRLSSFPSASTTLHDKGLSFVHVEGTFYRSGKTDERRTNPVEAAAIVAEIVRRLHDPVLSKHSIGVVTFNQPQQKLILALLTQLGDDVVDAAMQSDNAEALLVRNLEDVQGQERDIILFSVAFSKKANGDLPLNFGPLNRAGGERRLNVAVTRARRQVVVFCSFEPSDLKIDGSTSVGLRHLKTYLELAKFGPESSGAVSSQIVRPPDRHRDEIIDALRDAGIDCEPDVGLSDFKVDIAILDPVDKTKRILGILLDGITWHSRATVGDRDSLPVELLTHKMDWPAIERIWMPTWVRDRTGEVNRILSAIAEVQDRKDADAQSVRVQLGPASGTLSANAGAILSRPAAATPQLRSQASAATTTWRGIDEWTPWPVRRMGEQWHLDQLHDPLVAGSIHEAAQEIVATEGPISPQRLARQIGLAHDMQRVVTKRVEDILSVPMPLLSRDEEGFLFLAASGPDDHLTWQRSEPGAGRDIGEISLTELANAMRDVCKIGLGMNREDLIRVAAQAFGVSRVTVGIRSRMEQAIGNGTRRGRISEREGYFEAP
ncbi:MAG: DUF3320 domain-containing protein [Kineosporiaceae bacterium]|nr:DUF3320 domain-containing protein [Aeromicrobium sp.]